MCRDFGADIVWSEELIDRKICNTKRYVNGMVINEYNYYDFLPKISRLLHFIAFKPRKLKFTESSS